MSKRSIAADEARSAAIIEAAATAYAAGLAEGRLQARQEMRQRMTQALLDMAADDKRATLLGNATGPGSLERVA